MIVKINGIILSKVNYSDMHDIVNIYSKEYGRLSIFALKSKSGKSKLLLKNRLIPLTWIEFNLRYNPSKEIQRANSITIHSIWQNIYHSPLKNAIGMFLAELMVHTIRESVPDPTMWSFIVKSFEKFNELNQENEIKNFPIAFAIKMTLPLGIQPDIRSYSASSVFDMREGRFLPSSPEHKDVIGGRYAPFARLVMRMNYENMHFFHFTSEHRARVIDGILYYYSLHLPLIGKMQSANILKEII